MNRKAFDDTITFIHELETLRLRVANAREAGSDIPESVVKSIDDAIFESFSNYASNLIDFDPTPDDLRHARILAGKETYSPPEAQR